ncbi:MAG: HAD family hydrolase [Bdellovibrionales bacterium]
MSKPLISADLSNLNIKYVFTDIDDTLTTHGRLPSNAYDALWKLHNAGFKVIPVTGRPAGWCEMIARFWPVDGVIGENGGFYFSYKDKKMKRHFFNTETERKENQTKLEQIKNDVLKNVPGSAVASDQFSRLMDLAIDFCEDVPALPISEVDKIVSIYEKHGAIAKVSSIHVNGWFGAYSKISMIKEFCEKELSSDFDTISPQAIFVGDSPNDEPSFEYFKYSVGVANIKKFLPSLKFQPTWVTESDGGDGFCEVLKKLT